MTGGNGNGPQSSRVLLPFPDKHSGSSSRRQVLTRSRALLAVIAVSGLVLLICGLVFFPSSHQSSPALRSAAPTSSGGRVGTNGSGPRQTVAGVAVGYPQTRSGAIAAAVNYETARTTSDYFTDPDVRHRILAAMMTREALQAQLTSEDAGIAQVMSQFAPPGSATGFFFARGAALGQQLTSFTPTSAVVNVWMAEITGTADPTAPSSPSAAWDTYIFSLRWQSGDWKVSSISAAAAPVPTADAGDPTPAADWAGLIGGFDAAPPAS